MEFEFEKNGEVEAIDRVPEQFRGLYQEANGKFVLGETFKGAATAFDGLNKALRAARKDADAAKRNRPDLSAYDAVGQLLGLEGEEARSADSLKGAVEATLAKLAEGDKQGKVNWEKMKRDLEASHKRALEGKDGELNSMQGTLVRYLVSSEATRAIASHKGVPELLLPQIQARTKVVKEGSEYVVRVVDESGDPRGNASGGFMTIEDLVKELKASPVFGRAFESEALPGSGARPGGSARPSTPSSGDLSPTERIARGLQKRGR